MYQVSEPEKICSTGVCTLTPQFTHTMASNFSSTMQGTCQPVYTVDCNRIVSVNSSSGNVGIKKSVEKIPTWVGSPVSCHVIQCANHILKIVETIVKNKALSSTDVFASNALRLYQMYSCGNNIRSSYIRAVIDLGYIIASCLLIVNTGSFNKNRFLKLQKRMKRKKLNIDIVNNKLAIILHNEMPFIFTTISGCLAYSNQIPVNEETYKCYLVIRNLSYSPGQK